MAFNGTYEHTLDAKNRLTVPSKYRAALAGTVFLVRGVDPCIELYPAATYSAMAEAALARVNPLSPQGRELRRVLHTSSHDLQLDSAGRVMLPPRLMEHAGIQRDVVIAGAGECLELWDRSAWEDYDRDLVTRAPELTAQLGHPA